MKIADIQPGVMVAITDTQNHGINPEAVRRGAAAIPAKVIAVGKFRWQQDGLCARTIVGDGFTNMVRVMRLDLGASFPNRDDRHNVLPYSYSRHALRTASSTFPGFPDGLKLTSKKLVWREELVPLTSVICPWDFFLRIRDERLLADLELNGYQQRIDAINEQLSAGLRASLPELPKGISVVARGNSNAPYVRDGQVSIHLVITADVDEVTGNAFRSLIDERADIERRMSCSR
jgi:hypothetical protein